MENLVRKKSQQNPCNPKKSYKVFKRVGGGAYGNVYKACNTAVCNKPVAVKVSGESLEAEYKIAKKINDIGSLPMVFGYEKCPQKNIMYSEFIPDGDLKTFIKKSKPSSIELKKIVAIVLIHLMKISNKDPSFRHHDLHTGNVLITRTANPIKIKYGDLEFNTNIVPLLTDLGLSTINGIKNPQVENDPNFFKKDYGIYRESNKMYDFQFLMNSLHNSLNTVEHANFITFVRGIFKTDDYLVANSNKVKNFRLRSDVKHDFPSFDDILKNGYFSTLKPKKVVKVNSKKYNMPNNMSEAKKKALAILSKKSVQKKPLTKPPPKAKTPTPSPPKAPLRRPRRSPLPVLDVKSYPILLGKKCDTLKKAQIVMEAQKRRIRDPMKKTKAVLCNELANKPGVGVVKSYLRVDGKKCDTYKKAILQKKAAKFGIDTTKKTKFMLCVDIVNKM